jgi:HEAT repeat protein
METLNDDAEPAALEAVRSLRRLGAARAVPELGRLIRNDRRGTELRREAVEALTAIAGDEAASTLVPLLATRSPQVRLKVAEMLANHATGDELPALRARARRERSPAVRRALREAIARAQAADAS